MLHEQILYYSEPSPNDHPSIMTTCIWNKIILYIIQWPLKPPRYSTITTRLSGQNKGLQLNLTPFIRPAISRSNRLSGIVSFSDKSLNINV